MKNYKLFILVMIALLSGCSTFGEKNSQSIVTPKEIYVDSKLLEPCWPLPELVQPVDLDSLASNYVNTIQLYGECAIKQDASIEAIKRLSNKQDKK